MWWNGEVEQCWWKSVMEQCWWNSVVEQRNSDGRTMWWNSGTVLVEHSQWKSETAKVEQCGETVE